MDKIPKLKIIDIKTPNKDNAAKYANAGLKEFSFDVLPINFFGKVRISLVFLKIFTKSNVTSINYSILETYEN